MEWSWNLEQWQPLIKVDDTWHHHRGHGPDMLFTDQKLFLDKVMSSSWWCCLSTSFVKRYPQFTFKFHFISGRWKTGRNFFFPVWNLLNKLWVVVHSSSWKFGMYFVYFFIGNWNFLPKFCNSDLSVKRNILTSYTSNLKYQRMRNDAITRFYILYESFTTWCQLETYMEDCS